MTPYSRAVDRARALYRIPTVPEGNRVLEVCLGRKPLLSGGPDDEHTDDGVVGSSHGSLDDALRWYRQSDATGASDRPPLGGESFDLVVLHHTLEDIAVRRQVGAPSKDRKLLAQVADLLEPGGWIAGAVSNVGNAPTIVRRLANGFRGTDYSVRELSCLLERSGLVDVRIFRLMPDCDSPIKLVEAHPTTTRMMLRYELGAGRVRLVPFLLKRLAVEFGTYGWFLRRPVFFLARKPC